MRSDLPFMIDGIVVEMLNKEIIKEYFYDPKGFIPQHNFAVKLPCLEEITEVTDIDFCVGNTGRITPRIWFKPVEFNGTTHQKQQISNYKRFKNLNLGKGSKIIVSYRNDCLSYITRLEDQPKGITPFKFISKCPICGGLVKITKNADGEETLANCSNHKCPAKLKGKIENYLIKMDIKGIKGKIIEKLYENKLITDIPSLYSMDYKKVAEILGPKVAENIKNAIEGKEYFDYEILGSLSIKNFSLESAKLLCKEHSLEEIIDLINDNNLRRAMKKIDGFEDTTIQYVIKGIIENSETIEFLGERGYKEYKENFKNTTEGLNIAVTGWRPDPALSLKLETMGFTIKSSVSKKVDLLVYSGQPGATKTNKAKELGIEMMSIEEFKNKYKL
jgi:DNA ligase (NAD+)